MNSVSCACVFSVIRRRARRRPAQGPLRSAVAMEWEARGERSIVFKQLQTKFGEAVAVDLQETVASLTLDECDRWIDAVVGSPSLEQFHAIIGSPEAWKALAQARTIRLPR